MKNILEFMLDALTTAYQRTPESNIGRLLSLFADNMERAQGALITIREWRDIQMARGAALDRIGVNYGVIRDGTDDDFYRLMIRTKIISLISGGDVDTLIMAIAGLYDIDPSEVDLREVFPAKIAARINYDLLDAEHRRIYGIIARITKRIMAAGVGLEYIFWFRRTGETTLYHGMASAAHKKYRHPYRRYPLDGKTAVYIGAASGDRLRYTHGAKRYPLDGGIEQHVGASGGPLKIRYLHGPYIRRRELQFALRRGQTVFGEGDSSATLKQGFVRVRESEAVLRMPHGNTAWITGQAEGGKIVGEN